MKTFRIEKAEDKFEVGDWFYSDFGDNERDVRQIISTSNNSYYTINLEGFSCANGKSIKELIGKYDNVNKIELIAIENGTYKFREVK